MKLENQDRISITYKLTCTNIQRNTFNLLRKFHA